MNIEELNSPEAIKAWIEDIHAEYVRLRSMPYKDYLQTDHWKQVRLMKLRRAEFVCEQCGRGGKLDVHHKTYEHRGYEDDFLREDLIVLCRDCHARMHGKLPKP